MIQEYHQIDYIGEIKYRILYFKIRRKNKNI